jgi:hypothetical protein
MKRNILPFAAVLVALSPAAFADVSTKACELTSPEEIQATIGVKVTLKGSEPLPNGTEVCVGKAGVTTVTIRLHPKKDDAERDKETDRIDALQKAGAGIDTRKVGTTQCMEIRPGGKATRQAYTTTCTTLSNQRAPRYIVLEVSNPSQSFEMRKLAPLADSMAARLF